VSESEIRSLPQRQQAEFWQVDHQEVFRSG